MSDKNVTEHAKALSERGASKGGRARADALTPQERSEIASRAAEARWGSTIPKATHEGELEIAERVLPCAVLENGKRLFTQEGFLDAIGRAKKAKAGTGSKALVDGLPPFLAAANLKPFISTKLKESTTPVVFRSPSSGGRAFGYAADLLPMVCEVYLRARDAGALHPVQAHIAEACDLMIRALAHVGIIALVDEATGYQEDRARDELAQILEAYISEELRPWVKRFPNEFFRQVYRLHGWRYIEGSVKRPQVVGKLINKYVYEPLPPGVTEELKRKNPTTEKGYRKHKHHQFLTAETGIPHLDKQLTAVTLLMRISPDKETFEEHFDRAFGPQINIDLPLRRRVKAEGRGEKT